MDDGIKIERAASGEDGWEFLVSVAGARPHRVTLSREYWSKLTDGSAEPEKLVEESFRFLLERESDGGILAAFDLPEIGRYFPEYEDKISARL